MRRARRWGLARRGAAGWAAAALLAVALAGCTTGAFTESHFDSIDAAQRQVPFRLFVPSASALPGTIDPSPSITATRLNHPPRTTPYLAGYLSVSITYRYRPGVASSSSGGDPVLILETSAEGGASSIGVPVGSQHAVLDGIPVEVSQPPDSDGTEVIWTRGGTEIELDSSLVWDQTIRIFRSMAGNPPLGAGAPITSVPDAVNPLINPIASGPAGG